MTLFIVRFLKAMTLLTALIAGGFSMQIPLQKALKHQQIQLKKNLKARKKLKHRI